MELQFSEKNPPRTLRCLKGAVIDPRAIVERAERSKKAWQETDGREPQENRVLPGDLIRVGRRSAIGDVPNAAWWVKTGKAEVVTTANDPDPLDDDDD